MKIIEREEPDQTNGWPSMNLESKICTSEISLLDTLMGIDDMDLSIMRRDGT